MRTMNKKVIVIGAGPAGLTAAYELLKTKEGYDVTVFSRRVTILAEFQEQ